MVGDPEALLQTWFGEDLDTPQVVSARSRLWFSADESFDDFVRQQFGALPDRALRGDFDVWHEAARSTLALVIALDQLPRNLFRGTLRAFAYDAAATHCSQQALARKLDWELHPVEAAFLYFPLEHAEELQLQAQSVEGFRALLESAPAPLRDEFASFLSYAERHAAVIQRFGRFPHRNAVLGRPSTPEEIEYLEEGGETFDSTHR